MLLTLHILYHLYGITTNGEHTSGGRSVNMGALLTGPGTGASLSL